jgi:hypothetical protein
MRMGNSACIIALMCLCVGSGLQGAPARAVAAHVVEASISLRFAPPKGWIRDPAAEKKLGLYRGYIPAGSTFENAESAITVSFDKKDEKTAGLDTLKNYFADDMRQTLQQVPDAQFARWQPSKLDPAVVPYMSIEIYGKERNQPAPQHLVIVDAGDGFYSVTVTAQTREMLKADKFDTFFNSLAVSSQ